MAWELPSTHKMLLRGAPAPVGQPHKQQRCVSVASIGGEGVGAPAVDQVSRRALLSTAVLTAIPSQQLLAPHPGHAAATLTVEDVTPKIVPPGPLTPRCACGRDRDPLTPAWPRSRCARQPILLLLHGASSSSAGAKEQHAGCAFRREQQVISVFEQNTFAVANIYDITLQARVGP